MTEPTVDREEIEMSELMARGLTYVQAFGVIQRRERMETEREEAALADDFDFDDADDLEQSAHDWSHEMVRQANGRLSPHFAAFCAAVGDEP